MKQLTGFALLLAAGAAIVMSYGVPNTRVFKDVQTWWFAEMLDASEAYNSSRPGQMVRDAEYAASQQRILEADRAAHK